MIQRLVKTTPKPRATKKSRGEPLWLTAEELFPPAVGAAEEEESVPVGDGAPEAGTEVAVLLVVVDARSALASFVMFGPSPASAIVRVLTRRKTNPSLAMFAIAVPVRSGGMNRIVEARRYDAS